MMLLTRAVFPVPGAPETYKLVELSDDSLSETNGTRKSRIWSLSCSRPIKGMSSYPWGRSNARARAYREAGLLMTVSTRFGVGINSRVGVGVVRDRREMIRDGVSDCNWITRLEVGESEREGEVSMRSLVEDLRWRETGEAEMSFTQTRKLRLTWRVGRGLRRSASGCTKGSRGHSACWGSRIRCWT